MRPDVDSFAQMQQVEGKIKEYQLYLSQIKLLGEVTEEDVEADAVDEALKLIEETIDDSCWLPTHARQKIGVTDTCRDGWSVGAQGLICIEDCATGYSGADGICLEDCDDDETDAGLRCIHNDQSSHDKDIQYAATESLICEEGDQFASECYEACDDGWHGNHNVCWRNDCPAGYTKCGVVCEEDEDACDEGMKSYDETTLTELSNLAHSPDGSLTHGAGHRDWECDYSL